MKRRVLLSEMGIAPGNMIHAYGHIRARLWIASGDVLTVLSIGGNGRCVRLQVLMARGGQTTITFHADEHDFRSLAWSRLA